MPTTPKPITAIENVRVLNAQGGFGASSTVHIEGDRFTETPIAGAALPGEGLWLIPGVYDAHSHITWNDFHREDRDARTQAERDAQAVESLRSTLASGATSVRDGGGATAELRDRIDNGELIGPRLQVSVDMISAEHAGAPFEAAVQGSLDKGAQWIKLVATFGSTADPDAEIESNFTEAEFRFAARAAESYGAKLMVHAWGGHAIDFAIEQGSGTIEHGIYLTKRQAEAAASTGIVFVPTLTVYQLLIELIESGHLEGVPKARIVDVVADHAVAVRTAHQAGLPIAIGSDYSIPEQHGTNLREIGALIRAGIPAADALLAATANGALLFGDQDGGRIAPGLRADAVVLRSDPTDPATFDDPRTAVAVVKDGVLVHLDR